MEVLKEQLAEQARRSEHLSQEIKARDWERWQLLQLLHEKDRRLAQEEGAVSRQRATLSSAMATARHYRILCSWRAWREHVRRLAAERSLSRSKAKVASVRLRHACDLMRVALRNAASRQMSSAMHALWLQSAPGFLELPDVPAPLLESIDTLATLTTTAGGIEPCHASLPGSPQQRRGPGGELLEDLVMIATPRRQSPGRLLKAPPCWELHPVVSGGGHGLLRAGPPSEASTCAPPSLTQSTLTTSLPSTSRLEGRARLVHAVDRACLRRLAWGFRGLSEGCAVQKARAGAAELAASKGASALETLEARVTDLSAEEGRLASRAAEAQRAEQTCKAELREAAGSQAALRSQLRATAERSLLEEAASRRHAEAFEHELATMQAKHEELESRLASKVRWRREAEQRMHRMVACGESLEKERAQLRRELKEAQNLETAKVEQVEQLRDKVVREEQLAEILKARVWALEEDGAETTMREELERSCRREDAAKHGRELAALERERAQVREALRGANRSAEVAEARAAESARWQVHEAEERERAKWANMQAGLQQRVSSLQEEVAAEQQRARSAAAEASAAQQHARRMEEQLELSAACSRATPRTPQPSTPQLRELDSYAELVERLQEELARERAEREAAVNSLGTLRTSYRMLVQRSSPGGSSCGGSMTSLRG